MGKHALNFLVKLNCMKLEIQLQLLLDMTETYNKSHSKNKILLMKNM